MVYSEKVLKPVQTWLPGLSARHHYTTNLIRLWHTTKDEKELTPFSEDLVWHYWRSFAAADGHSQARARTPKERNKRRTCKRMVYNDWGLYSFVQMLAYRCLRFGKQLFIIDERNTSRTYHVCKHKQDMPLWTRTYRC